MPHPTPLAPPLARLNHRAAWLMLAWLTCATSLTHAYTAHASACCLGATATGVGRLKLGEAFSATLATQVAGTVGLWNASATYKSTTDTYKEVTSRFVLRALGSPIDDFMLYADLPFVLTYRAFGDLSSADGGVGDVTLGTRYDFWPVGRDPMIPGFALIAAVTAPTGVAPADALAPLGANTTGRGAWVISLALNIEKAFDRGFLRGEGGISIPFESPSGPANDASLLGIGGQATLIGGYEITPGFVLALLTRFNYEGELRINGINLPGSATWRTIAGIAASYAFDPTWTLQASIDTGIFVAALGQNLPGVITGTLGLRYGFYR